MVIARINGRAIHTFSGAPHKRQAAGHAARNAGHAFQITIKRYLDAALPFDHIWTASAVGVNLGKKAQQELKDIGVHRGWSDYQILFPSAVTRYIEAKSGTGRLTPDQERFRDFCIATGRDIWAEARNLEDVEVALRRWKVPLRCGLEGGSRYATD